MPGEYVRRPLDMTFTALIRVGTVSRVSSPLLGVVVSVFRVRLRRCRAWSNVWVCLGRFWSCVHNTLQLRYRYDMVTVLSDKCWGLVCLESTRYACRNAPLDTLLPPLCVFIPVPGRLCPSLHLPLSSDHFNSGHGVSGLLLTIVLMLQVAGAVFRPHPPPKAPMPAQPLDAGMQVVSKRRWPI